MDVKTALSLDHELRAAAPDGRIACAAALDLARRLSVSPRKVGAACNRLGLKIVSCQLGCFEDSKTSFPKGSPS
ncbi:MAG: hypothetical protein AB1645_04250 [Bacillota bacterium]